MSVFQFLTFAAIDVIVVIVGVLTTVEYLDRRAAMKRRAYEQVKAQRILDRIRRR